MPRNRTLQEPVLETGSILLMVYGLKNLDNDNVPFGGEFS